MALGLALVSATARATAPELDGGIDAHGFQLAAFDGDVRDGLMLVRPGAFEAGSWWAGALLERAEAPLVWVPVGEDGAGTPEPLLDDLFAMNISFGGAVHERVRFDVAVPLYLSSVGADGETQGAALGDARFTTLLALVRPDGGGFGLGLTPWVDLPVGARDSFLGQSGFSGGAALTSTLEHGPITVSGALGFAWMPALEIENLTGSDRAQAALGLGYAWNERLGANLEARASLPMQPGEVSGADRPAEGVASLRGRGGPGAHWTVGGASALSGGASAAAWRLFVGGGFGRAAPPVRDQDFDGHLDTLDLCPEAAETKNSFEDEDGCPDELGRLRVRVEHDGAPVSAELALRGVDQTLTQRAEGGVSLLDGLRPGTPWELIARAGPCLEGSVALQTVQGEQSIVVKLQPVMTARLSLDVTDAQGATLPGVLVRFESELPACAPEGRVALDAEGRGEVALGAGQHQITLLHPDHQPWQTRLTLHAGDQATVSARLLAGKARVEQRSIVILDRVYFAPGADILLPESHELLEQVARVLQAWPDIKLVEVAGHTDDGGPDDYNLDLSTRRADAVRSFLVELGVAPERLVARGYGETRPIDTNTEDEGRATNRRVEFDILSRTEE